MQQISQFSDGRLDAQELHLLLVVVGALAFAILAALDCLAPADKSAFLSGGPVEALPPLIIVLTGEIAAAAFICIASQTILSSAVQGKFARLAELIFHHLFVTWQTKLSDPAIYVQIAVEMALVRIFSHLDFCSHLTTCWTPGVSPRLNYA